MAYVWRFIQAVGQHLLTLLAGCAMTALLGLFEKFVLKREVSLKAYVIILAAFAFYASFQSWRDAYTSLKGRERDFRDAEVMIGVERRNVQAERDKTTACEARINKNQDDFMGLLGNNQGLMSQQAVQMHGEQANLESCLIQLGKAQQQEPLRVTSLLFPRPEPNPKEGKHAAEILMLTNHPMERVRIAFTCNKPFNSASAGIMQAAMTSGGVSQLAKNAARIDMSTVPSWSPTMPLIIRLDGYPLDSGKHNL